MKNVSEKQAELERARKDEEVERKRDKMKAKTDVFDLSLGSDNDDSSIESLEIIASDAGESNAKQPVVPSPIQTKVVKDGGREDSSKSKVGWFQKRRKSSDQLLNKAKVGLSSFDGLDDIENIIDEECSIDGSEASKLR